MRRDQNRGTREEGRFWRITGQVVLLVVVVGGLGVGSWLTYLWQTLPSVAELKHWKPATPLRIYAANGQLLSVDGPRLRDTLQSQQIPEQLRNAFVSAENGHFWSNNPLYYPVSFPGILRAAWIDLIHFAPVQGASTIPEQVARNFYLSPKKTITRKVREILLAYKLARHFSHRDILDLYLNKIYLGNGAYGVGAAAQIYYGKPVDELTLPQMAMLAGLPAAPEYFNPLANPKDARSRRNYVIGRMLAHGYITAQQAREAEAAPLSAQYHNEGRNIARYATQWIERWLVSQYGADMTYRSGLQVYTTIVPRLQTAANESVAIGLENYSMGLDSLDPKHYRGPVGHLDKAQIEQALNGVRPKLLPPQDPANLRWGLVLSADHAHAQVSLEGQETVTLGQRAVAWTAGTPGSNGEQHPVDMGRLLKRGDVVWLRHYVDPGWPANGEDWRTAVWKTPAPGAAGWQLTQIPKVQGALVGMDNATGAIVSLAGGFSYSLSHFDRALYAYRQPGSSFKPFVYAAALDGPELLAHGKSNYLTPVSLIADTPLKIKLPNGTYYKPTNYEKTFSNTPIPLWKDLADSINVPSVRILMHVGIPYAIDYAKQFGFKKSQLPPVPSLVLGAADVTPLQMTRAYAVFSNGGFLVKPYLITKVVKADGDTLPLKNCALCVTQPPAKPAITPGVAYLMTRMLQRVIQDGTGIAAKPLGHFLAGKTGTTNDEKNAWFVGYGRHYIASTWVGFDNNQPMGHWAAGAREALPIWIHYMKTALADEGSYPFFRPQDITQASINPKTGTLESDGGETFDFLSGFLPPASAPEIPLFGPGTSIEMPANATTPSASGNGNGGNSFLQQFGNSPLHNPPGNNGNGANGGQNGGNGPLF
ncbi:penicillin-binding protein 1A [Acidihalobacter prosperus]|nr:PBP1A family penicillin-binding protein [Acidihalobacter prosperus]